MSAPERGRKSFLAAVLKRTGEPKKLKSRDKKHKKKVGYVSANGSTAGDEAAIGTGSAGGGGAGGGN